MRIYIYQSDNPKKYSLNFLKDAYKKETGKTLPFKSYSNIPRDQNGKPGPLADFHFSISHSGNFWGIAVSDHPVGFDLSTKRKISPRALRKILCPNEKLINNDPLHNFVIKEAYAKKSGLGLSLGFSKIDANTLKNQYHPFFFEDEHLICYAF